MAGAAVGLVLLVGGVSFLLLSGPASAPKPPAVAKPTNVTPTLITLSGVADQTVDEMTAVSFTASVEGLTPGTSVRYILKDAPQGAAIDAKSGTFAWIPTELQGPGSYAMTVEVAPANATKAAARQKFTLLVTEVNQPPVITPVAEQVASPDVPLTFSIQAADLDAPAQRLAFKLLAGTELGAKVDERSGLFHLQSSTLKPGTVYPFVVSVEELAPGGLATTVNFNVRAEGMAEKPVDLATRPTPPVPSDRSANAGLVTPAPTSAGDQVIMDLYASKKLFEVTQYTTLRTVFVDEFKRQNAEQIRQGFGTDYDEMTTWLEAHPDVMGELYTALKPPQDNVATALRLFTELKKAYPDKIESYANLAIAIAVTWDNERAIYDYAHHQRRAKSSMPDALLGALENFKYMIDAESVMQGRAQFMPWEFLVYAIDHKTPVAERQWALQNYLAKRAMIGKCYKDVPYDHEMLRTQSATAKLNNLPYTLANIQRAGGVCAMQADYSSRVGKSLGVPAAYIRGEAASGDSHAWVMWVELQQVTRTSIVFTLESEGRYNIDKYYVGTLEDPHTGEQITDRDMELRLQTVGINPLAKRHAALVMRAYPTIINASKLDFTARQAYLASVTRVCPGNEDAWLALAKMSREGLVAKADHKRMLSMLDQFFTTFRAFPDFTWKVFDDFIAFQENPVQRAKLYERLVLLYESGNRPDLACEARLKLTDYHLADKNIDAAIQGLAITIKKFPDEGRYVPRMLDKLDATCVGIPEAEGALSQFYLSFLPLIPPRRGNDPSKYCMKMYQRGIDRMQQAGNLQAAAAIEAQLQLLRAGKPL